MAKDPAFLFYPGDYLRDTQMLSSNTQVAYDRIMCELMRNICITQQQLNFLTKRLSDDEKDELMMVLSAVDGGFQIDWITESITKRRAYSESRRKNREGKPKKDMINICETHDLHMENENENENKDVNVDEKIEDNAFENFWNKYHEISGLNKTDTEPAEKYWKKLTKTERQKAIDSIKGYVDSIENKKYIKKARTYLSAKSFNDEVYKPNISKGYQSISVDDALAQLEKGI